MGSVGYVTKSGHAALAALAFGLSGCGGYSFTGPLQDEGPTEIVANLVTKGTFFSDKKEGERGLVCPLISVRDGTDAVRIYAGAESSSNVRYQYSLGDVGRQCSPAGKSISLKVGVEGRVILGPSGQPGTFSVPVRVVVIREATHEPEFSKLYTVPVTVPAGSGEAPFRFIVDNVSVPFVSNKANIDYAVEVGFDSAGARSSPRPRRRRKG